MLIGAAGLRYTQGRWDLSGVIDAGYGRFDSRRTVAIGGLDDQARATPDSWQIGAHLHADYRFGLGRGAVIEPFADLHGTYVQVGGYAETDPSPFNLDVARRGQFALSGDLGVKASAGIQLSKATLRPFVSAAIAANGAAKWRSLARIAGQPAGGRFAVTTAAPDWLARGEVGADLIASDRFDLSVGYAAERAKDFRADNSTARVSLRF